MRQLTQQLAAANAEKAQMDRTLRQPGNAEVFQRSILLNALVERKAISWTRIFADLEHVKPYNVRVIQIRLPKIHSDQQVSLDMTVGMEDWVPSGVLIKNLEESPLFGPVLVQSWSFAGFESKIVRISFDRGIWPETLARRGASAAAIRNSRCGSFWGSC